MRKSLQFTVYSLQFFVILFIFGVGFLFIAPTIVESSHGQAGPATTCGLANFQDIPETITANTLMQFTATFSPALSAPYTLLGRICIHKAGTLQGCGLNDGNGNPVTWGSAVTSGTYNYSFTPATEGVYKVFCSSSNANDYECRGGTQGDIDSLGRNDTANHPCEGGASSKGFTVAAAAPASPAAADITVSTSTANESVPNVSLDITSAVTNSKKDTYGKNEKLNVKFHVTDSAGFTSIDVVVVNKVSGKRDAEALGTKIWNDGYQQFNYDSPQKDTTVTYSKQQVVAPFFAEVHVKNVNGKEVTIPFPPTGYSVLNTESTAKVRIAQSQAELESCANDSTCQELNYNPANVYSYKIKSFGQKQLFVRFISNSGNTKDQDKTTIGGINPIRITYAPLPNCSSIQGPLEGLVGQNLTFTARYDPPAGVNIDLRGDIVAGKNGSIGGVCSSKTETQGCSNFTDMTDTGETKALTLNFDQPGTYDVFCRAVNNTHFVECRGNSRYVNTQNELTVRACNNGTGGATRQITITQDEDAPATNVSPASSGGVVFASGKNNGDTFDVSFASSDGNGAGVNATFVGVWEGKAFKDGNATYFCPTPGESRCPANWAATGGTMTIKVPSFVEYNAIDRAGNNENPPANTRPEKSFALKSDDIEPPTSLASLSKGSGSVRRDEDVDINFIITDIRGIHAVFARVWEGATAKVGAGPGRDISIVGNGRKEISETKKAKAPFYLEYHAEDINGNVEKPQEEGSTDIGGGRRAHTRVIDVDRTSPILNDIQVESREVINNGDEVTLTFNASDPDGSGVKQVHAMVYEGVTSREELTKQLSGKSLTEWNNGAGRPVPYRAVSLNAQGTGTTRAKVPFYVEAQSEDNCNCVPKGNSFTGNVSSASTASGVNNDTGSDKNPSSRILNLKLKKAGTTEFVDIDSADGKTFARGDAVRLTLKANDNRDKPGSSAIKQIHVGIWRGISSKADIWDPKVTTPPANSGKSFTYAGLTPAGVLSSPAPGVSPSPAPAVTPASPQPGGSKTMTYTCIDDDGNDETTDERFALIRFLTPSAKYAIRVDNKTKSPAWSGCDVPESGDFCDENITQNQKEFYAGDDIYDVWYHTVNTQGNFSPASEHMTVTCQKPQKVLGVSSSTGEVQESIEAEAPFYLEYTAQDINGNFEKDNQNPNSFSAVLDSSAPTVSDITIENQPEARNIGTEVTLKFSANDEAGGTGLKTIHTAVWVGVSSKPELLEKLKGKKAEEWDQNPSDIPLYAAVSNGGTRKAKVPFYAEAQAEDNCNCVPKGNSFTGNVTVQPQPLSLDHNDREAPTNSRIEVKSATDPNKTSGFAAGEEVELTFSSQDNRGIRVIHTGLWEGVSTKEEAITKAREQSKNFEDWQNPTNPLYQGVANNGKRTARVPFYLEYVAQDINGNFENVSIPPGVDDGADKPTPGGVHAFAIEIPTVTEKIRVAESRDALNTCASPCREYDYNPLDPKISFTLSGGTGNKTIWVRFINNKRRNTVDVSQSIRRLSSSEGVSFVFSPNSVTTAFGSPQFEVAVQLNTRSTIRDYNISAVDIKLKLDNTNFTLVNFVPNADLFETVGSISPTATDVHFLARRKNENASLTGTVELGKIQLRPPASGLQVTTKISIEENTAQIASSDIVGPVPIAKPIAQATISVGGTVSPSPSISPSPAGSPSPRGSPQGSPSPGISPSPGVSPSPGQELACDFNLNGRYDDTAPSGGESDLDVWTKAALGQRFVTGASWDADCTGPSGSEDEKADILDLNNWLVLFERHRLSR